MLMIMVIQQQLLLTLNHNRQYVTTCCDDIPLSARPSNMANLILNQDYTRAWLTALLFENFANCCLIHSTFSSIVIVNVDKYEIRHASVYLFFEIS